MQNRASYPVSSLDQIPYPISQTPYPVTQSTYPLSFASLNFVPNSAVPVVLCAQALESIIAPVSATNSRIKRSIETQSTQQSKKSKSQKSSNRSEELLIADNFLLANAQHENSLLTSKLNESEASCDSLRIEVDSLKRDKARLTSSLEDGLRHSAANHLAIVGKSVELQTKYSAVSQQNFELQMQMANLRQENVTLRQQNQFQFNEQLKLQHDYQKVSLLYNSLVRENDLLKANLANSIQQTKDAHEGAALLKRMLGVPDNVSLFVTQRSSSSTNPVPRASGISSSYSSSSSRFHRVLSPARIEVIEESIIPSQSQRPNQS